MNATIRFSSARFSPARAFTLIEVLIGVLVLALGLLGLGAIIPVVIREQRAAVSMTLGNEAANAAKKYLLGRPDLNAAMEFDYAPPSPAVSLPQRTIGWDRWLMDPLWSPTTGNDAYLWERWHQTNVDPPDGMIIKGPPTAQYVPGDFGWQYTNTAPAPDLHVTIRLADRLWPNETVQGAATLRPGQDPHRPQFVWDFIGRRVKVRLDSSTGKPAEPEQLQVAIFVRPLDMNIRVPLRSPSALPLPPITLRDVVLNRGLPSSADARVPVRSDGNPGGALAYLPTNAGVLASGGLSYSEPISLGDQASGVTVVFDPLVSESWLEFQGFTATDNRWKLVSQSGQKLLDNLGNVYTVRGTLENLEPGVYTQSYQNHLLVVIDPPVPSYVPDTGTIDPVTGLTVLRQIIFTPQIPAAVEVFTISRTVP